MTRTYVSARSEGGGRGRGGTRVRSQASRYCTSFESFTESHEARELPLQQLEGCSCRCRRTRWARQRRCQRPAAWSSGWRFSLLLVSRLPSHAECTLQLLSSRCPNLTGAGSGTPVGRVDNDRQPRRVLTLPLHHIEISLPSLLRRTKNEPGCCGRGRNKFLQKRP